MPHEVPSLVPGSVTDPLGFRACGIRAGIKAGRRDMTLIESSPVAAVAGVFTSNRVAAAPVRLCQDHLAGGRARAILVNSGNANACTGEQGRRDALRMAECAAACLGAPRQEIFVCSTGTIGVPLPMPVVEAGIAAAFAALSREGGIDAAEAICTTDNAPKRRAVRLEIGGRTVTIGAMAKGAGMIEPNMATMLAFLTTDAAVDPVDLQACLRGAVDQSFNRISVDGCQSTNDTVLFLANGAAGAARIGPQHPAWPEFCRAVNALCLELALAIVADGEGATKVATVLVEGAADAADAARAARAVANSLLVKTSWYGQDPNWGRVIDAVGYSGAAVDAETVDIDYDGVPAMLRGVPQRDRIRDLEKVLAQSRFSVKINLHIGDGTYRMYASDCTEAYVRFNSAYTT